ncbi:MAG: hypothetical protein LBI36_05485 [Oscillospiraceae bacterium]|nr:hypothetical protein [Oscillospiraceae bacterium]
MIIDTNIYTTLAIGQCNIVKPDEKPALEQLQERVAVSKPNYDFVEMEVIASNPSSVSAASIDWNEVRASITRGFARGDFFFNMGDIGEYLNNASALRAKLETQINYEFTGEVRAEQLKTLNSIFKKAIDDYADEYVKKVGSRFEGIADFPESEIRESIYGIFARKSDTPFSANDLTALNRIAVNTVETSTNIKVKLFDTSTTGLELGLCYLGVAEIMDKFGVSAQMRDKITAFIDSFIENKIQAAERAEKIKLERAGISQRAEILRNAKILAGIGRKSLYIHNPNIRGDITEIVNRAKELYASEKSKIEILREICALAYEQNKDNPSDFWQNFYDNGSGKSTMADLLKATSKNPLDPFVKIW